MQTVASDPIIVLMLMTHTKNATWNIFGPWNRLVNSRFLFVCLFVCLFWGGSIFSNKNQKRRSAFTAYKNTHSESVMTSVISNIWNTIIKQGQWFCKKHVSIIFGWSKCICQVVIRTPRWQYNYVDFWRENASPTVGCVKLQQPASNSRVHQNGKLVPAPVLTPMLWYVSLWLRLMLAKRLPDICFLVLGDSI